MKRKARAWIDRLQQHVVLTAAEWRIIIFVVGVFALGLAAKHYRAAHSNNERVEMRVRSKSTPSKKPGHPGRKRKSAAPETSPDAAEPFDD